MVKVDLLLINPPFHQRSGSGSIFPLGLGYIISSIENSGYSWDVIDCSKRILSYYEEDLENLKNFLNEEMGKYLPELIGIGPCITTQIKALKIIADCCKEHFDKERIFAGGPLASIDGQEWFFFDYLGLDQIIKGDGESAVLHGLQYVKQGRKLSDCTEITIRNRIFFNEINDINKIPFPHRLYLKENIFSVRRSVSDKSIISASMITSRGCLYNCYYCVSGNMKYKKFRKRTNENIVEELISLKEMGVSDIVFYDDCFFYNKYNVNKDVEAYCSLLIDSNINMTWQMEIRPDILAQLNNDSIVLLSKSGCRQINIGIEKTNSVSQQFLGKNIEINDIRKGIDQIKGLSMIKVAGTFILGGGNETESDIKSMIKNSKNMNLDYAHYNPLFIYPGTRIYETVFHNEREWVDHILRDKFPWGEIIYENEHISGEELLDLVDYAYTYFYAGTDYENSAMVQDRFNLRRKGK